MQSGIIGQQNLPLQIFKCDDPMWILNIRCGLSQNKLLILQKLCVHIDQEEFSPVLYVKKKKKDIIDQTLEKKLKINFKKN